MFRMHDYPISNFLETMRAEYRKGGRDVEFLPFGYNADFLPLAASGTANVVNATDHDADFVIIETMQSTWTSPGGAFTGAPLITVRITYDVSGRRFEDRDSALVNLFGRGGFPHQWPRPMVIKAKASFTTTLTNQDAANAYTVRLTYWGVKAIPKLFRAA